MKRIHRFIPLILLSLSLIAQLWCTKGPGDDESGIITFKIGNTTVRRAGVQPAELKLADRVTAGDILVTGEKSVLAVQFRENCVIRIDEKSTFRILSATGKDLSMSLSEGSVMSKLVRTGNSPLAIKTPTSLAAIRGTRFSVTYRDGTSLVAVSEGTVQVAAIRHDESGKAESAAVKETPVEAGNTAVITETPKKPGEERPALELEQRKISDNENKSLKKIELMPIIPEPGKKKSEDLEKNQAGIAEKEQEIDKTINKGIDQEEIKKLIAKRNLTIGEIRRTFNRIDEITLYNGKVISGAILTRGAVYTVLTPGGTISVPEKTIKNVRIAR